MSETLAELENRLALMRALKLCFRPVPDKFDAAALRETHQYIFQDFPKHGLSDPPPGQFRHKLENYEGDWCKLRALSLSGADSYVAYSPMNESDLVALDAALKDAQPDKLRKLMSKEFSVAISTLYAKLDYIHPFYEGNSRTLRSFTEQIARASGYELNWDRFNTPTAHDLLYIARDRAVGEQAIDRIIRPQNREQVVFYMDKYAGNPGLCDLVTEISRPLRAAAFEKTPVPDAIRMYPELENAYKTLAAAGMYFQKTLPGNTQAQTKALTQTRQYIQEKLNAGETKDFHRPKEKVTEAKIKMQPEGSKEDHER